MSRLTEVRDRVVGREGYEYGKEEGRAKNMSTSTGITRAALQFFLPASSEFFIAEQKDPDRAGRLGEPMRGTAELGGSFTYDLAKNLAAVGAGYVVGKAVNDAYIGTAVFAVAEDALNAPAHTVFDGVGKGASAVAEKISSVRNKCRTFVETVGLPKKTLIL